MSILGASQTLGAAAAAAAEGLRLHLVGEQVTPPAVIVGVPPFEPLGMCSGPASAVFPLYVVVDLNDRSLERLWELVPAVWSAVEDNTDGVVRRADPGTYVAGAGADLPCYELAVEYPLSF